MKIEDVEKMDVVKALEAYRDLQIELAPTLEILKKLERFIKSEVLATGEIIKIDGAKTEFRKGYTRSSWDNKGLRGYAVAHPEVLKFVKETTVNRSVAIKLSK